MKVKIRKTSDLRHEGNHPNGINVGFETEGEVWTGMPTIGKSFWVGDLKTSAVRKIASANRFHTKNSIYEWEIIK